MGNILQDIFCDYYEEMIYTLRPRQTVIENVDRMPHCGDPSYGGAGDFSPWRIVKHFDYRICSCLNFHPKTYYPYPRKAFQNASLLRYLRKTSQTGTSS